MSFASDSQIETWQDIPGYEGLYQISNLERVRSFHKSKEGILLISHADKYSHKHFVLCKDKKKTTWHIHEIIYLLANPDFKKTKGFCIDHKDNNARNNKIDNLQRVSRTYNSSKHNKVGCSSKYHGVNKNGKYWCVSIDDKDHPFCEIFKSEDCAALAREKHIDFFKLDYVRNKIANEGEVLRALYLEQKEKQIKKEKEGIQFYDDKYHIQVGGKRFYGFLTIEEAGKKKNELIKEFNLKKYTPYPLDD